MGGGYGVGVGFVPQDDILHLELPLQVLVLAPDGLELRTCIIALGDLTVHEHVGFLEGRFEPLDLLLEKLRRVDAEAGFPWLGSV